MPNDVIVEAVTARLRGETWREPSGDMPHPDWHQRLADWQIGVAARAVADLFEPVPIERTDWSSGNPVSYTETLYRIGQQTTVTERTDGDV